MELDAGLGRGGHRRQPGVQRLEQVGCEFKEVLHQHGGLVFLHCCNRFRSNFLESGLDGVNSLQRLEFLGQFFVVLRLFFLVSLVLDFENHLSQFLFRNLQAKFVHQRLVFLFFDFGLI